MNLFFCEACGKRLTDLDLDAGTAIDKKLKGVYCKQCGSGVLTQVTLPTSSQRMRSSAEGPPRNLPGNAPTTKKLPVKFALPLPSGSTSSRSLPHPAGSREDASNSSGALLACGVAGVVILLGLLAFISRPVPSNSPAPRAVSAPPAKATRSPAHRPAPAMPAVPKPERRPAVAPIQPPLKLPNPAPSQKATPSLEALAQQDFYKLEKFEGLAPEDKAGRLAAVEAFIKKYGDTIIAARAQHLADQFRRPEPAVVQNPPMGAAE